MVAGVAITPTVFKLSTKLTPAVITSITGIALAISWTISLAIAEIVLQAIMIALTSWSIKTLLFVLQTFES